MSHDQSPLDRTADGVNLGIPLATVTITCYLNDDGDHDTIMKWSNHLEPKEGVKLVDAVYMAHCLNHSINSKTDTESIDP